MKAKNTLIKILRIYCIFWIIFNTIRFLLGKADTLTTVFLFVCYFLIALPLVFILFNLILNLILKNIYIYKNYKLYKNCFYNLKAIHKERYRLYFYGNIKEIEIYTEKINEYGAAMLEIGNDFISKNLFDKKYTTKVKELLEEVKILMNTTQPQ